ncbi:hypothetical protein BDV95DRAFT_599751 [Massariosphaeria phaeospora]|uniref:Copper-fist domain-containing protein n=1 Tax=Massariosphaeria phaeospora TaxID=100035 RepID=A0A7C8MBX6_9PLEO|nr:hypothetical protein BDV95DRAFT_599751 [Massariosphaeria phaeospora]
MWADINGERKKVACGPCIRGHRSSKCDHRDRVLVEVRKPGRPLSSCPHPSGSCSCERVVINYTIPKTSECACPSERPQPTAPVAGSSSRVQKSRNRKSTATLNPATLERAMKASQDAETNSSSLLPHTPTDSSFPPSDRSTSNEASPPSSASSTPRILPTPQDMPSNSSEPSLSSGPRLATSQSQEVSSCCQPKPVQQGGSCCSIEPKELPKPLQTKKSCCSGPSQPWQANQMLPFNGQPQMGQNFNNFPPLSNGYGLAYQANTFMPNHPGNAPLSSPFGFNTPIYNHLASGYQHPMASIQHHGNHTGNTDHNCHCGESCSCFGCAAHPNNATMAEYIRMMHQFMSTGGFGTLPPPTYDMPAYMHPPGFGAESYTNQPAAPTNFPPFATTPMNFHPNINAMMSMPNTPASAPSPWQSVQTPVQTPNAPVEPHYIGPQPNAPLTLKTEEAAASPVTVDSPNEGREEDTPTLSPSSYFWSEMTLPSCNDATGTCQCGDGCECVGCLTHGGHNGVLLEVPAEHSVFPDFDLGLQADDAHTYIPGAFSEAPS